MKLGWAVKKIFLKKDGNLGYSMTIVIVAMIFVRALSALKDIFCAYYFGPSEQLDSFIMALLIPTYFIGIFVSPLHGALVPIYVEEKNKNGASGANIFLSKVLVLGFFTLILCSVFCFFTSDFLVSLIAKEFSTEKQELTFNLVKLLSFSILFQGLSGILSSALAASKIFFLGTISGAFIPIFSSLAIILFSKAGGIWALAVGSILGSILEMIFLFICVFRAGIRIKVPNLKLTEPITLMIREFSHTLIGVIILSSWPIIDQSMAATLGPTNISLFNFGSKVVQLVLVFASSIWIVLFPHFSKLVAENQFIELSKELKTYSKRILAASMLIIGFTIIFSKPIISILFQRGNFNAENTEVASQVQNLLILQLPFYIIGIILTRVLLAAKKGKVLTAISILNLILNIVLNYILMNYMGLPGIACATSVVYAISCLLLTFFVASYLRSKINHRPTEEQKVFLA